MFTKIILLKIFFKKMETKKKTMTYENYRKNVQKKTILVRAKEDWPPMYPGVDMELLPPRPGAPSNGTVF